MVKRDGEEMLRAIELAAEVRCTTSPNPWVGCVLVTADGQRFEGATQPPGGPHAEIVALNAAKAAAADPTGATAHVTLEPCSHHGRTPPCTDSLIDAGVKRVVVGITDPDPHVAGEGIHQLETAGIKVETGVAAADVSEQLAPYIKHRLTGHPYVILKLAASLDGRTAAPDGSSRWITGEAARADAHRLRAESDAVLVGAGTVRADDPALTVRHVHGPDPRRIVLGKAPPQAKIHPALELDGDLEAILDSLGRDHQVVQLLIEGGASVATAFHQARLVDHYVLYVAPVLFGGDDGVGLFRGPGAATMADVWRGRIVATTMLGEDIRVDIRPGKES